MHEIFGPSTLMANKFNGIYQQKKNTFDATIATNIITIFPR